MYHVRFEVFTAVTMKNAVVTSQKTAFFKDVSDVRGDRKGTKCLGGITGSVFSETANKQTNKQTPWPLVRERTIPTDRPPLVDEI
jgi:hypothetical protein